MDFVLHPICRSIAMLCDGPHHICNCKERLLKEAVETLRDIQSGLKDYKKNIPFVEKRRMAICCIGALERIERIVVRYEVR
jgi:hypothetical protein